MSNYHTRMHSSLLYTVLFAPRGKVRMVDMGRQIAQQYLNPFDGLIGIIGEAASGKSMLIKGMFPGLELSNDDEGVNVRPLPLLNQDDGGFYSPHTFHMDMRFETAFTQPHLLAEAVTQTLANGKRVIVEHFDLLFPLLERNADLLIGIGEEIMIARPNIFGPEPEDIAKIVFPSIHYRRMAHTAEDLCEFVLPDEEWSKASHGDVRRGFVRGFNEKPSFDPRELEALALEMIKKDVPVAYKDENHITIGEEAMYCTGPRMHVRSTGEIINLRLLEDFPYDPMTGQYLLVGYIGRELKGHNRHLNWI